MMISEGWAELMLPILRRIFNKHKDQLKDYIPVLFNVESSTKAQEFTLGVGNLGLMRPWDESGRQVFYEDAQKGFKATYTHRKFSLGEKIERELVEDDQYSEIKKRIKNLSQSVYYTRQHYGVSVFNNAFSNTFAGPDGVALCSDSHPASPVNSTTFSNMATLDLTADNVELVRNRMVQNWRDDKGNLLAITPDTIIVPASLRKAAMVIADTDREPDTTDHNINIWKGSLNVIEHLFLTDPTAWFLIDMSRMKNFLNWYDRRKAKLETDTNFDTEVSKYKVVNRFSYGWDDPTFIYGCRTA